MKDIVMIYVQNTPNNPNATDTFRAGISRASGLTAAGGKRETNGDPSRPETLSPTAPCLQPDKRDEKRAAWEATQSFGRI